MLNEQLRRGSSPDGNGILLFCARRRSEAEPTEQQNKRYSGQRVTNVERTRNPVLLKN